jgi:hypothetical protein
MSSLTNGKGRVYIPGLLYILERILNFLPGIFDIPANTFKRITARAERKTGKKGDQKSGYHFALFHIR